MAEGTITGTNGTWKWKTTPGPASPVDPNEKSSDTIDIEYTPNAGGTCKDVRLIQVVEWTAYDNGNVVGKEPDEVYAPPPPNHPYRHRKGCQVVHNDKIYVVDYKSCEADPYYNGNDQQDKTSKGDATTGTPTKMRDRPRCAVWTGAFRGNVKRVVKSFRVCAVCADTGAILDCMGWTCTATAAPKDSGTVAIPDQTSIPPQEAFDAALREFMKTHVRTEGGKKYWWCPESSQKRGEIPDGFGRQWAPATETGFHWLELDDQQVGGAQLAASATPVLTAGLEDAGHAAVKFTWSGDQDKTTMSLVVSPLRDFTAADIAPFVRRGDARLANDLVALAHQYVSPDFCHNLLSRLSAVPGGLAGAPADVTITIVANLRSDRATAAVGSLDPRTLAGILNELRGFESTEGVRDALQYLSLNLALRTEWRAAAPPRGCLHPASIAAMARSILRS